MMKILECVLWTNFCNIFNIEASVKKHFELGIFLDSKSQIVKRCFKYSAIFLRFLREILGSDRVLFDCIVFKIEFWMNIFVSTFLTFCRCRKWNYQCFLKFLYPAMDGDCLSIRLPGYLIGYGDIFVRRIVIWYDISL